MPTWSPIAPLRTIQSCSTWTRSLDNCRPVSRRRGIRPLTKVPSTIFRRLLRAGKVYAKHWQILYHSGYISGGKAEEFGSCRFEEQENTVLDILQAWIGALCWPNINKHKELPSYRRNVYISRSVDLCVFGLDNQASQLMPSPAWTHYSDSWVLETIHSLIVLYLTLAFLNKISTKVHSSVYCNIASPLTALTKCKIEKLSSHTLL